MHCTVPELKYDIHYIVKNGSTRTLLMKLDPHPAIFEHAYGVLVVGYPTARHMGRR